MLEKLLAIESIICVDQIRRMVDLREWNLSLHDDKFDETNKAINKIFNNTILLTPFNILGKKVLKNFPMPIRIKNRSQKQKQSQVSEEYKKWTI